MLKVFSSSKGLETAAPDNSLSSLPDLAADAGNFHYHHQRIQEINFLFELFKKMKLRIQQTKSFKWIQDNNKKELFNYGIFMWNYEILGARNPI